MTIKENSICNVVQSFPILLILAQKYEKCLKTPLIYEPPKTTPSPEYYEALDALFQNLFGHGYPGHEHNQYPDCGYGQKPYGYGTYGQKPYGYGTYGQKPYGYGNYEQGDYYGTTLSQGYVLASPCSYSPNFNTHSYPTTIHSGYPNYGLKKINVYNLSGTSSKGTYAPTQVYNQKHKYKIVVKKNKKRSRPHKLQNLRSPTQWQKLIPNFAFHTPNRNSQKMRIGPFNQITNAIISEKKASLGLPVWGLDRKTASGEETSTIQGVVTENPVVKATKNPVAVSEETYSSTMRTPTAGMVEPLSTTKTPQTTTPTVESRLSTIQGCEVAGRKGECILLDNCDPYVRLIRHQQGQPSPALTQFLRQAHCGFRGTQPMVCCPILDQIPSQETTSAQPEKKAAQVDRSDFVDNFLEPVCGFSNASFSRVVGGVDAKLGDFPWMALLGYKRRGVTSWNCGGSLVTSKHVLTAAHCIHNQESSLYVVRLGELDLSREDEGATPLDVLIRKMVKHEQYDSTSVTNDIGILILMKDVQFTDLIRPICLPHSEELRANTFERYNPMVAGWGNLQYRGPEASVLQAVQLPVVSNTACENAYKNFTRQVIDSRVLCAGYADGGKDACSGDSGGPLMQPIWYKKDTRTYFYQIGVVSFGRKCAESGFPGVYSRVTSFIPWIEEKLLGHSSTEI